MCKKIVILLMSLLVFNEGMSEQSIPINHDNEERKIEEEIRKQIYSLFENYEEQNPSAEMVKEDSSQFSSLHGSRYKNYSQQELKNLEDPHIIEKRLKFFWGLTWYERMSNPPFELYGMLFFPFNHSEKVVVGFTLGFHYGLDLQLVPSFFKNLRKAHAQTWGTLTLGLAVEWRVSPQWSFIFTPQLQTHLWSPFSFPSWLRYKLSIHLQFMPQEHWGIFVRGHYIFNEKSLAWGLGVFFPF